MFKKEKKKKSKIQKQKKLADQNDEEILVSDENKLHALVKCLDLL